jgi:putative metalloenzyme radical SAM/SPASM domain maturase
MGGPNDGITGAEERFLSGRDHPAKLFVEITTQCNLRCGMCVKQNSEGSIMEGSMSPETFDALIPAFPNLDALVLNGIGESLLHPHLEAFIRRAKKLLPRGAWVGFQTNGMLLKDGRAASLVDAGLDRICLSLDTVSHDSFRALREGGEMSDMEAAFAALNKAKGRYRRQDVQIGIEFVLMRDNLPELPAALRWAASRGVTFALVTQLLPYHRSLVNQAAYDTNTTGAIAIYESWKAKAKAEGADIGRYFEIFMKYSKSAEDLKILGFIEQMKSDASAQGITLHLERLLLRDEEWFMKVEQVFEEARQIAYEEGINIMLPGTAPQNTRKCEFVEEDGAFVSWDGDVHPCYFLWHRYRCYIGGWEKHVRPWVFGNLREKDILEIWNDQKYGSFRENVLHYKFPFCFDCSFALCDYVQGEVFEQDCYVESVPCGACLWCTGLFKCLQ